MDFIINLSILEGYHVIYIIIDGLIKERYYILYIVDNKGIFAESIINIFIKYIFRLYKLLTLIIFDRGL